MSSDRSTPEEILKRIQAEEKQKENEKRGKLYIFLGYAAGVGKTCAMLDTAQELKKKGIDVVAGYIEPHARWETSMREKGLKKSRRLWCLIRELSLENLIWTQH